MASRKRSQTVAARVTEREIALIRAAAADAGVNVATFMAEAVLDRARCQLATALSSAPVLTSVEPTEPTE